MTIGEFFDSLIESRREQEVWLKQHASWIGLMLVALYGASLTVGWYGLVVVVATLICVVLVRAAFRTEAGYLRPPGQMVIATIIALVLAVLLGIGTWALGTWGIMAARPDEPGEPTPLTVLLLPIGASLFQGVVVPLYAWWRWSGDRSALREGAGPGDRLAASVQHEMRELDEARLQQAHAELEDLDDRRRRLLDEIEGMEEERTRLMDEAERRSTN